MRSSVPNATSATAIEPPEIAVDAEGPWVGAARCLGDGGGLAAADDAAAADGEGDAGSATVTVAGLLPFVGSAGTVTQAPGE